MFRSFLSWRYLVARRVNLIGIVGITVGVGAMILILSIMTGFLEQSRAAVRGSLADLVVTPHPDLHAPKDARPREPDEVLEVVRAHPAVAGAAPHLNWMGIVTHTGRESGLSRLLLSSSTHGTMMGVQLVGVDVPDEFEATELREAMAREPRLRGARVADLDRPFDPPPGYGPEGRPKASVVVGEQLYHSLSLRRGDEIEITTVVHDPKGDDFHFSNRKFVVAGTFRSLENEIDLGRIYIERSELADFLGGTLRYVEVLVRLHDYGSNGRQVRDDLRDSLAAAGLIAGDPWEVRTWEEFRGNLLGAIENERVLMAIMLSLVLLVAGFTVFAILSMMVTEKRRDIGVLNAIGATPRGVLQVFLMIAFWDALIGATAGAALGIWGALEIDAFEQWLSRRLDVQIFDRNVYLFDHIPSVVQPLWVAVIVLGAFLCALLFAAYPAWRASRLDPLEALRYE